MTFPSQVKSEILSLDEKLKKCCSFSFLYGFMLTAKRESSALIQNFTFVENTKKLSSICSQLFFKKPETYSITNKKIVLDTDAIRYSTVVEIANNVFKCPHCRENFLKALFSVCGTVCDPSKMYQLEIIFNDCETATEVISLLNELSLFPKLSRRGSKYVVYFKRSEDIEDFLIHIGAKSSAFNVMNSKINKEIRNTANRITNCDSANINKSINASKKYIDAINGIIEKNMLELLPQHLRDTAKLRLEHLDLNFTDLGLKFEPPVSKSGIYHRLEKILEFYNNLE